MRRQKRARAAIVHQRPDCRLLHSGKSEFSGERAGRHRVEGCCSMAAAAVRYDGGGLPAGVHCARTAASSFEPHALSLRERRARLAAIARAVSPSCWNVTPNSPHLVIETKVLSGLPSCLCEGFRVSGLDLLRRCLWSCATQNHPLRRFAGDLVEGRLDD
jgi:hypothetical protein